MNQEKVDIFFAANGKKLPVDKANIIREKMLALDESKYATIASIDLKDPVVIEIISIIIGGLGVDRFILGQVGMGVLKLLTGGLCGILWLIDVITIMNKTRDYNYNEIMKYL